MPKVVRTIFKDPAMLQSGVNWRRDAKGSMLFGIAAPFFHATWHSCSTLPFYLASLLHSSMLHGIVVRFFT
ncbi:Hypothetical protein NTJ_14958 [Nesidiocoris tenuis]|uniref:Uncharacterized protein n=1 Tax=Nesidiocoris tenuis TaxID=355587 RepID=A0ABN7BE55_9HEMI|nr:Hypothetical protein NTJ_14958 [Nesidiocoris tenuis]